MGCTGSTLNGDVAAECIDVDVAAECIDVFLA